MVCRLLPQRGFALVTAVALLVVIVVVALGMLSLSTVSIRASAAAEAAAQAKANARAALMIALGRLQESAGPDDRVTARADILGAGVAQSKLTGVWKSRAFDVAEPPVDAQRAAKEDLFQGWLVSSADPTAPLAHAFVESPSAGRQVEMVGSGTLGSAAKDVDRVKAEVVPIGQSRGGMAWFVADEGIKARINTTWKDAVESQAAQTSLLGEGRRPAVEKLDGMDGLERTHFESASPEVRRWRMSATMASAALAAAPHVSDSAEALARYHHDLSVHAAGLFTDVARGGWMQDLNTIADLRLRSPRNMPDVYSGWLYEKLLGMDGASASTGPRWENLLDFANSYRTLMKRLGRATPVVAATWPGDWRAMLPASGGLTRVNTTPPSGLVLFPVVARVQMIFSLVARDIYGYTGGAGSPIPSNAPGIHEPQAGYFRGTKYQYDLQLLYTPVVTLHNPYNTMLEFHNLEVEFANVPFATTVYRNGIAQNRGLAPIDKMYANNETGRSPKSFKMKLKSASGSGQPGSATFRMLPGETKLFSPYIDPNRTYAEDLRNPQFWDYNFTTSDDSMTRRIEAVPGWRGDGIGFSLDWWNPADVRIGGPDKENGRWMGCIGLARDDEIHLEFAPLSVPQTSNNRFLVVLRATPTPSSARPVEVSALEFDYEKPDGLTEFLLDGKPTLRYPKQGTVNTLEMLDHSSTPIKSYARVKPFALFTIEGKTTSGGRDPDHLDGRHASKPWSLTHPVASVSTQKVLSEHPAWHSHEIDLRRLDNGTADVLQLDVRDRANFVTGHTSFNGVKFGMLYDLPLHPPQTLASLNGANPAGSSAFPPRFAQPIGNSWAHPMLAADRILDTSKRPTWIDHSYLLNAAMCDRFYFSGLGDRGGTFGSSGRDISPQKLAEKFADASSVWHDPRMKFHAADGQTAEDFVKLFSQSSVETPAQVAAWQIMEGRFNIHSTSVAAWKAMLASVHDAQALVNLVDSRRSPTSALEVMRADEDEARISRFRMPASHPPLHAESEAMAYWLGSRSLTDQELDSLAQRIVDGIRERGPFLSMAEFVNRSPGGNGDSALKGVLQQAIDASGINDAFAAQTNAGWNIPAESVRDHEYAYPDAATGPSWQGAPGAVSQADILSVLGNAASARSDTFIIRAYGEAANADGLIASRVWCEAVVQRHPEWIDSTDAAVTRPEDLTRSVNRTFGRRFTIVAFRWLDPQEI